MLKKRVYIIDEVHMLSKDAFNALLKIMEEPPAHLLFILATTELQKVPATILSRCPALLLQADPAPRHGAAASPGGAGGGHRPDERRSGAAGADGPTALCATR